MQNNAQGKLCSYTAKHSGNKVQFSQSGCSARTPPPYIEQFTPIAIRDSGTALRWGQGKMRGATLQISCHAGRCFAGTILPQQGREGGKSRDCKMVPLLLPPHRAGRDPLGINSSPITAQRIPARTRPAMQLVLPAQKQGKESSDSILAKTNSVTQMQADIW